jgi:hypothetical protein
MIRSAFVALLAFLLLQPLTAQKWYTKDALVKFLSDTPLEKIDATSHNGTIVLDPSTWRVECKVLIKNFLFEKALMQEHFNENYMESTKYPNATFKGRVTNPGEVRLDRDGDYTAKLNGTLTIHGVDKAMNTTGKIVVKDGTISVSSSFAVAPADFGIPIPSVVSDKIAKSVRVTVNGALKPLAQ